MGLGFCMPREAWRLPPPNLFTTRAELDRLGLTALRAMVEVEPYGSGDLGGDPSDDEPPSMTSASPSEDDDPEDPENPKGKKKKKKKKTRRPEGRRSQEAKAIATSKIVVNLPEFTGKDLSAFAENFGRFLRFTGQAYASGLVKCDLLLQCCKTKYLEKQVRQIVTNSATFADVLVALERQYPTYETNLSIRAEIQNLPVLPNNPKYGRVSELLADLDHWAGRLTPGSYSSDDLLFWLVAKLPRELWDECLSTAERKARSLRYESMRATPGAGAGEGERPAPEQLPSWRRRFWRQWQRVPRVPTWAGDCPQTRPRPYHGERQRALLV